jgi:polar amino acid transport system substrate-binding protein
MLAACARRLLVAMVATGLVVSSVAAGQPTLRVAVSLDIPPYVIRQATDGLEVALAGQALSDYELRFVQLSYAALETAVQQGRADVSIGVQQQFPGVYYSGEFITFVNAAISKRADGLKIAAIADLTRYRVLAWKNAWYDLGGVFGELYAPGSPHRADYVEFADQREQVRRFWTDNADIAVIDQSVFAWFSHELGHRSDAALAHALFAPVTNFRVAFREAGVRDAFDRGLARLCAGGGYATLLARYGVVVVSTVCDR